MKKKMLALLLACMMVFSIVPMAAGADAAMEDTLTLATTTSTQDSGLLDVLIPAFEKEVKTKVKVVAVGSGQAMEMGMKGDADVLLVHSRAAEDKFITDGYGETRKDVMHNQFLLVGPASDPAKVKDAKTAVDAFKAIAGTSSKFISRGDKSGTNTKELSIWTKAEIKPAAPWYIESGQGMGDTLQMANEMQAYTLTDEATFLTWKSKGQLEVVFAGDKAMFNPYGVITVSPAKFPAIHNKAAVAFMEYITGEKGQSLINAFGKEKYGKSLFVTDAIPADKLSAAKPAVKPAPPKPAVYTACVQTKVFAAAKGKKSLGVVKAGTVLTVTGTNGAFYMVKYKGKIGYVPVKAVVKK